MKLHTLQLWQVVCQSTSKSGRLWVRAAMRPSMHTKRYGKFCCKPVKAMLASKPRQRRNRLVPCVAPGLAPHLPEAAHDGVRRAPTSQERSL